LKWWEKRIGPRLIRDITPESLEKACKELEKQELSGPTINRYLAALSAALSFAVKRRWITYNPGRLAEKYPENPPMERVLSAEERTNILDASRSSDCPYMYPIVLIGMYMGLRKSEFLNLTWDKVSFEESALLISRTKNGDKKRIPMPAIVLEALIDLHEARQGGSPLLFPGFVNPLKPFDIRKPWDRILKAAEIKTLRIHDLRHTCATWLVASGASIFHTAEIMGHRTTQTTMRYTHLQKEHLRSAIEGIVKVS
jgi:integrase